MYKKLAKLKFLPNNFQIIEQGDHVICAVSGKQIGLDNLNYWSDNVVVFKKSILGCNYYSFFIHFICRM